MRRRQLARVLSSGFEGFEMPPRTPKGGLVDPYSEVRLLQGGRLPERGIVSTLAPPSPGPLVAGEGFGRGSGRPRGMLDQPSTQNVGRAIVVTGVGTGRNVPILAVDASDQQARQITVFLTLLQLGTSAIGQDFEATIQFGTGGHRSDVVLDLVNGTSVSLVASSMRIFARALVSGANHLVGAFIGYGQRPSGAALRGPQLTRKVAVIAPAGTADFLVPAFATSLSIVRTPASAPYSIRFVNGAATVTGEIAVPANSDLEARNVEIPNDTVNVRIVNGAAQIDLGRVVFGLSL